MLEVLNYAKKVLDNEKKGIRSVKTVTTRVQKGIKAKDTEFNEVKEIISR